MRQDAPSRWAEHRLAAADLRSRVLAQVARSPARTRAEYKRHVALLATAGVFATALLFVAMGGMAPGTRPAEMIAFTAGSALLAGAVLMRLSSASAPSGSMLGRPRPILMTAVVTSAPLLALVVAGAAMAWPEPARETVAGSTHLACEVMGVVQGALPLLVLLVLRRGTDPVHPAISGAALGMTAGAWAVVMATLRCPHSAALHGVVAHVGPTLLLTALGAVLGGMLLRVRSET